MSTPEALLIFVTLLTAVTSNHAIAEPLDPAKAATQSTILFRKSVGHGELICTAGLDLDPAFLSDLVGPEAADQEQAVYEIYVDWVVPGHSPVRIWSKLSGIQKHPLPGNKFLSLASTGPLPGERLAVLDMTVVPEPQNGRAPAYLLVAVRIRPGSAFGVYRVDVWGGEVLRWYPADLSWTAYDTFTPQDPQAVTLSLSRDGRCSVEVTSEHRHTIYEQITGKWEFNKTKQWQKE